MKNVSVFLLGLGVIAVLGFWMVSFQVDFNEVAVVTTFEKAAPAARITLDGGAGSGALAEARVYRGRITAIAVIDGGSGYTAAPTVVIEPVGNTPTRAAQATAQVEDGRVTAITVTEPGAGYISSSLINTTGDQAGLYWKWIRPVQRVRSYDARTRLLEDRLEEQQTFDKQDVIVQTYVAWRIDDALRFFQRMGSEAEAERKIRAALRDSRAVIGNSTFDQLTNMDPNKLKLTTIENAIRDQLIAVTTQPGEEWGVAIEQVGIKRIVLPETVTEDVFNRMKATRQRLAQNARSEGEAAAATIVSEAEKARDTIMAFAQRRAEDIRAEGDAAAAEYFQRFKQDQQFAIFLRKLRALRETLAHNTTFLIDPDTMPFDVFRELPSIQPADKAEETP